MYTDGNFYLEDYLEVANNAKFAWNYSPAIPQDENYTFLNIFLKGQDLGGFSPSPTRFNIIKELIKSHKAASTTAKIDLSEFCFFDVIPDHLLHSWFSLREGALEAVLATVPPPGDYDILHKIHVVTSQIASQDLTFNNNLERIKYDIFSSATGRLTTRKRSFPILSLDKKQRSLITPKNDLFLELDLNGAEIRTLLAFSGAAQPLQDIHEWNMRMLPPWFSRVQAKEDFFAWLYNPRAKSESYEKHYNKKAHLEHYRGGTVTTPFGRVLPVDPRRALNYLIQSTTSDIVMENAYKIMKRLHGHKSHLAFTMHDSIVLDFSKEDHNIVIELKEIFESNQFGRFLANVSIGKDFGSMRELEI